MQEASICFFIHYTTQNTFTFTSRNVNIRKWDRDRGRMYYVSVANNKWHIVLITCKTNRWWTEFSIFVSPRKLSNTINTVAIIDEPFILKSAMVTNIIIIVSFIAIYFSFLWAFTLTRLIFFQSHSDLWACDRMPWLFNLKQYFVGE